MPFKGWIKRKWDEFLTWPKPASKEEIEAAQEARIDEYGSNVYRFDSPNWLFPYDLSRFLEMHKDLEVAAMTSVGGSAGKSCFIVVFRKRRE
jgi:hypothetical protein